MPPTAPIVAIRTGAGAPVTKGNVLIKAIKTDAGLALPLAHNVLSLW